MMQQQQNLLFPKLQKKQRQYIMKNSISCQCVLKIRKYKSYSQKNQFILSQLHVRAGYLLQWDSSQSQYLSGLKLYFNVKIKQFFESKISNQQGLCQNKSSINSFILSKFSPQLQYSRELAFSNPAQDFNIYFISHDERQFQKFHSQLIKMPIIIQIEDLRAYYKPYRVIGQNDLYKAYQANIINQKGRVSVKSYPKENFTNYEFLQRIKNQFYIQSLIQPPFGLKIFKIYLTKNTLYVINDNYNCSLQDFIQSKTQSILSFQRIKKLIFDLLLILSQLHEKKITHGNIHPSSILLKNTRNDEQMIFLTNFQNSRSFSYIDLLAQNNHIRQKQTQIFTQHKIMDMICLGRIFQYLIALKKPIKQFENESGYIEQQAYPYDFLDQAQQLIQLMKSKQHSISAKEAIAHKFFTLKNDKISFNN